MFLYWSVNKELYFNLGESIWFTADWPPAWPSSAVQKIKKLSETPVTVHNIAKLCVIDGKNREITKKLVQPVPPHPYWTHGNFKGKMTKKDKMAKNHFSGVQNDSQSV